MSATMSDPADLIGRIFKTRGKHPRTCKVVDVWTTRNSKGDVVRVRFVATHEFAGQIVTDCDVPRTTVQMGLLPD